MEAKKPTVRTSVKERAYQLVKETPFLAEEKRRTAPRPEEWKGCRKLGAAVKKALKLSIGSKTNRTPVLKLFAAWDRIEAAAKEELTSTSTLGVYVQDVLSLMRTRFHATSESTDRAWKPWLDMLSDLCELGKLLR